MTPRSNLSRESAILMARRTAEAAGGRMFTIAPTGSMKPTLDENSVVAVETVAFGQLRAGDIVIYRNSKGLPIVHRLYERANGRWFVLGDNNASVDRDAVTAANLLGRVCAIFYTSSGSPDATETALAQQ
jgi:signal peptidase I